MSHPQYYTTKSVRARRQGRLKFYFKITLEQYDEMLESQGGVCAICKQPPMLIRLSVDHDHKCCPGRKSCGKCLRGLICQRCNAMLGYIETDNLLGAIRQYLKV